VKTSGKLVETHGKQMVSWITLEKRKTSHLPCHWLKIFVKFGIFQRQEKNPDLF